jgi:hypothetical protein
VWRHSFAQETCHVTATYCCVTSQRARCIVTARPRTKKTLFLYCWPCVCCGRCLATGLHATVLSLLGLLCVHRLSGIGFQRHRFNFRVHGVMSSLAVAYLTAPSEQASNCQTLNSTRLHSTNSTQSQSHIATDGQSVSKSWCRGPPGAHDQIFVTVWQLRSCFLWGALSYERTSLSFVYATGPCQRSLSRVRVPWYSDHILLSQIWDFPFHRLLRLAGSRWRHSTPPPPNSIQLGRSSDIASERTEQKAPFPCWCGWRGITCSIASALPAWCRTTWHLSSCCVTSPRTWRVPV